MEYKCIDKNGCTNILVGTELTTYDKNKKMVIRRELTDEEKQTFIDTTTNNIYEEFKLLDSGSSTNGLFNGIFDNAPYIARTNIFYSLCRDDILNAISSNPEMYEYFKDEDKMYELEEYLRRKFQPDWEQELHDTVEGYYNEMKGECISD